MATSENCNHIPAVKKHVGNSRKRLQSILDRLPDEFTTLDYAKLVNISTKTAYAYLQYNLPFEYYYISGKNGSGHTTRFKKINKEITMPKPKDIISPDHIPTLSEAKPDIIYLPRILAEFKALPNSEKVDFICTLFPFMERASVIAKINECYPNWIFRITPQVGDIVFHPILGSVELVGATDKIMRFYGNGTEWTADRNGHLIINGKKDAKRTVFIDIDDYVAYMKSLKKKLSGK